MSGYRARVGGEGALSALVAGGFAITAFAAEPDAGVEVSFMLDEFEYRSHSEENYVAWTAALSVGNESRQLWLVSEGQHTHKAFGGDEMRAYYSHQLSGDWRVNAGWRGDVTPQTGPNWVLLGIEGELPLEIGGALTLFARKGGDTGLRVELDREFEISQGWTLTPAFKSDSYGHDHEAEGFGSGLSAAEFSLRLAYHWSPVFAPYVGINFEKLYGKTADWAHADEADRSSIQIMAGFSLAF